LIFYQNNQIIKQRVGVEKMPHGGARLGAGRPDELSLDELRQLLAACRAAEAAGGWDKLPAVIEQPASDQLPLLVGLDKPKAA
jgi:hypothetical protein